MGSGSAVSLYVISSAGDETDSTSSSSINFNFKKEIEQNPDRKAIAENYCVLIEDWKAKFVVVVLNIDRLLSTFDITRHFIIIYNFYLKELDNDCLKIVPDDLNSGPLKETMNLIRRQHGRISNWRSSFERRRRVYTFAIMIAVIIMLVFSSGFELARKWPAAVDLTIKLAMAIKATEAFLNVMLSEEERMLEGDEEVVKMMRGGERLMVLEFNNVQQKANTLKVKFMAEYSKLAGHTRLMEESKMMETISEMECILKALRRIVNGYGNDVQNFIDKFTEMVKK